MFSASYTSFLLAPLPALLVAKLLAQAARLLAHVASARVLGAVDAMAEAHEPVAAVQAAGVRPTTPQSNLARF